MAEGTRVEVKGLNKLTRALRRAGVEIKDLKAANVRVGNVVVRAASQLSPRATGALVGSIRPAQRQSGVVVRAGGGRVSYAGFVEFGTKKMPAQPYLRRGARESQERWMDEYEKELRVLVAKVENSADGTGD